jgi:hypothetical protein
MSTVTASPMKDKVKKARAIHAGIHADVKAGKVPSDDACDGLDTLLAEMDAAGDLDDTDNL